MKFLHIPDGGFDCITELTSAGEIIESLKAKSTSFYNPNTGELEKTDEVETILKEVSKMTELINMIKYFGEMGY